MNGAAASRCSKLSATSSRCLAARKRSDAWSADSPESTMIPSALTIAAGTSSGCCSAASETKCAPSAKSAWTARAASKASRVLPTPPGPVRVSSRTDPARSRSPTAATLVLAPDRAVRRHRQPAVAQRARRRPPRLRLDRRLGGRLDGRRELGGVLQDVLVQLAQRLCGLDAELVDESPARGLEGRQRVGLSSGAIQSASICSSTRRSWKGCAMTSASSWPSSSPWRPSSRSSSIPSMIAARRSSSSRARSAASRPLVLTTAQRLSAPDTERLLDPAPERPAAHRPRAPDAPGPAPAASGRHRARRARTSSR